MKIKYTYFVILLIASQLFTNRAFSQHLKPYFDKSEYRNMLLIAATTSKPAAKKDSLPKPDGYHMIYRSEVMGLDNLWGLWVDDNSSKAVISIRGTTKHAESWLANFYAAMVPAKGELILSKSDTFKYELSNNPKAAVHVGWLLSTAYLSEDILPKIDSLYKTGIKDFLLMGHSQGGAINFLLTSYLYSLQDQEVIPKDIRFKTYCSAAPKPGNLYFAYHYESITQNGWAFNIVNSADWVPETPISIQTLDDFNTTNPFVNAKAKIKKQKFPKNLYLRMVYNKLNNPTKEAQRNYEKYLGQKTSKLIVKDLKGFVPPKYYSSNNYVRTGSTIVLYADDEYYKKFPDNLEVIFTHHLLKPYLYLLDKLDL